MKENDKKNAFKYEKSLLEVLTTQMLNLLFNSVSEASKIILKARWRYQKHSTKCGGYIGKKIWIVRHLEMKNWMKMTKNNAFKNEKSLLPVLTTQMYNFLFNTATEASKSILNARWRYQKYSTKLGGYVDKKIWIVRHVEMKNWRKMTKKKCV